MDISVFSITAKKSVYTSSVFPRGHWFGYVNGYSATAPVSSKEQALLNAENNVINGHFKANMMDLKATYENWLNGHATSDKHLNEARKKLPEIIKLLSRLN